MERIELLINRLKEQFEQQADPAVLSGTVQLIQLELSRHQSAGTRSLGTAKVAVVLPSAGTFPAGADEAYSRYAPKAAPEPVTQTPVKETRETVLVDEGSLGLVKRNGQIDMVFDPLAEIPTLSHQPDARELNQGGGEQPESINDKLRQGKTELMEVLKETPVRDLRKAVGINDRFTFINDLFRGDESMYERSIKTINSFNIYAEAEYWITRELKVKLGWDKNSSVVQHFDQLVKRRFS